MSVADLILRFFLGGAVVSAFAAIGELFEPMVAIAAWHVLLARR